MLALIALSGLVACLSWGRWRWRRGFASAKEIASYDVLYWRAECERVQAILHDVPSDIVSQAMYATVLPAVKRTTPGEVSGTEEHHNV